MISTTENTQAHTPQTLSAGAGRTNGASGRKVQSDEGRRRLPARQVLARYGVTDMTLWRWLRDPKLDFPQPLYINRYRYWPLEDLEAWEGRLRRGVRSGRP